ncbi:MAG TPA: hypothetical protein VGF22_12575, partial [Acidimicrobiales bacterium]
EFLERDERQSAEKAERLAPVIEKVMARRPVVERSVDGYQITAIIKKMADDMGDAKLQEAIDRFEEDRAAGRRDAFLGTN